MARYLGKIKSFNVQKGWGFIECEETFEIYGKDIFIMKKVLPNGVANKGDLVTFDVVQGAGGPEATTVDLEPGDPGLADLEQLAGNSNAAGMWSMPQRAAASPIPMAGLACGAAGLAARSSGFLGFVKSYNPTKGWGFVTSDVLLQLYGKDVFFLKNSLLSPSVNPGDPVRFSISQGSKGPEAVDVTLDTFAAMGAVNIGHAMGVPTYGAMGGFAGRRVGPAGPRPAGGLGGFWSMPGAAVQALPAAPMIPQQARAVSQAMASQVLFGTVKSYHPEKGWGHIDCGPASAFYGKDVFLMRSALEDQVVQPGSLVSFRVVMAPKGPHAADVKVLPEGSFGGMAGSGQASAFEGVVKSFNVEKGWGFVTSAEIQQVFGKDIFIHKQELGGIVPEPGDLVHFTVEPGRTGQLEAKKVAVAGQPGFPVYKLEPRSGSAEGARSAPY